MKRPLVGITSAFSLGILISKLFDISIFYSFLFATAFLFAALIFIKSRVIFLTAAALGFLFLGAFAYKAYNTFPKNHIRNITDVNNGLPRRVLVQGDVINNPHSQATYYHQEEVRFLLSINTIKSGSDWVAAKGILLTRVFNPSFSFKYGDEVVLEGALSTPRPATNPGEFDYKRFLELKKIFYILKVRDGDFSIVKGRGRINIFKTFAYKINKRIELLIDRYMPSTHGAILNAILLGRREEIDEDINDDFVNTGTVHILSISGLHVGLLASIFMLLFKLLRLPFRFRTLALAFLLIFYSTMVDNKPPIVRSTVMILLFLFGSVLKKRQDPLNTLAFSAVLILFFNPNDLFNIGFQLSFFTMGSIIYFAPRLEEMFLNKLTKTRTSRNLIRAFLVSFSAWLGSVALIAHYFNLLSPITLLANIFVVPWMFLVLASALTFIAFSLVSSALGLLFAEATNFCISVLLKTVSMFSKIPFSYFRIQTPPWIFIICFYLILYLFFNRHLFRIKARHFLIVGLVFLNGLIWHRLCFERQDFLRITFLDVGKGDATFLEFPKGGTMLIDGGEGFGVNMGRLVVSRFLASKGLNKIDVVVATHPHTDHIGGLTAVLKNYRARFFVDNGDEDGNLLNRECKRLVRQKRIKRFIVKEGDTIGGFGDAKIFVLNPSERKFYDLNNNSLVLKLAYRDFSALFCADIKREAARNLLLRQNYLMRSDVLKIPHHGANLKDATFRFIRAIKPKTAIISVDDSREVNRKLLYILNRSGSQVFRTNESGAVVLTFKKEKYEIRPFKKDLSDF